MNKINISDEKLLFFKSAFEAFDKDKDGFIDLNFFIDLIKATKIEVSQEESSSFISELDFEKNGKLSFNEFMLFILRKYKEEQVNEIDDYKEVFKLYDNSGSNKITMDKFKNLINAISENAGIAEKINDEEVELMFKEANNNENSNELTFENFVKMINKKFR